MLTTKTVLPTFVRETVTFVATRRQERHTRKEGWIAKGTPWVRTLCSAWASDSNVASQKEIMIEYLVIIIIWIPLQSYRWLLSVAYPSEPDLLKFLDLFKNQLNSNLSNAMAAGSAGNGTDPETEIRSQRVFF